MFTEHFCPKIRRFLFGFFVNPTHTKPKSETKTDDK